MMIAKANFSFRSAVLAALFGFGTLAGFTFAAAAQGCTEADFASAVDKAGASLRKFNQDNAPKIAAALKSLQKKRGWTEQDLESNAISVLHSSEIAALDERANDLLSKIDELGEVIGKPDCGRLPQLRQAASALLETMQQKTKLTEARIAEATRANDAPDTSRITRAEPALPTQPNALPAPAPAPSKADGSASPRVKSIAGNAPPPGSAVPSADRPSTENSASAPGSWSAATQPAQTAPRDDLIALRQRTDRDPSSPTDGSAQSQVQAQSPAPAERAGPSASPSSSPDVRGYTIDEIKEATRGFFGTISTNLASVIEYAFSHYGRPSGYVLGSEGGGAFLAGARYGKGNLFMRTGGQEKVYWHGPSLGYDFGAEGSRTLFLIYKLDEPENLFRRFVGVDGSAYVLGGVGLTVLKGGPVLMAPIRTGVGLRLGANIGYVRFTRHATWNPF